MARCQRCQGSGKEMRDALPVSGVMPGDLDQPSSIWKPPCPECGGCGWEHCCEGEWLDDG